MVWQEVLKLNSLLLFSCKIERAGLGARLFQFNVNVTIQIRQNIYIYLLLFENLPRRKTHSQYNYVVK